MYQLLAFTYIHKSNRTGILMRLPIRVVFTWGIVISNEPEESGIIAWPSCCESPWDSSSLGTVTSGSWASEDPSDKYNLLIVLLGPAIEKGR